VGYREAAVGARDALIIDGTAYDVDYVGMDDGLPSPEDPEPASASEPSRTNDAAFRFLFQLGHGYMIHLYVVQAGAAAAPRDHFFHSFWLKDCAVAEVEMEEYGAPRTVTAPWLALPRLYERVTIHGDGGPRVEPIAALRFRAPDVDGLELELTLAAAAAHLRWTRARGWELEDHDAPPRPLHVRQLRFA